MKLKKRKLLILIMIVVLVLSQCIVSSASDISYDKTKCPAPTKGKPYVYNVIMYSTDTSGELYTIEYITIESDVRMCLYQFDDEYTQDVPYKHVIKIIEEQDDEDTWCYYTSDIADANGIKYYYDNGKVDNSSEFSGTTVIPYINTDCVASSDGSIEFGLLYSDMPIFDDRELAQNYCQTGDVSGAIRQPNKSYDLEGIYLEDFSVELHYSNYAKHIFWDFHYQIPESIEQAIADGADCYIDLTGTYKIHTTSLSNSEAIWNIDEEIPIDVVINLAEYPNGYSMNFDDVVDMEELENWFWGIGENTVNSAVTGSGSYGFNDYLCRTDTSRFDLTLIPVVNGTYGTGCSTSINLLNPKELSYWNSTPSDISVGDYDMVSNLANSEGYYNTVVGYDNVGNPTYTYYYVNNSDNSVTNIEYKEDGSTEEVASDGSINVTPTFNPTFNNNPTISPTIDINIEGDNLNNEVDNIVGEGTGTKEDNESFVEKFLGFFNVFKDNDFLNVFALLFAFLPNSVSDVIVTAIGIIAGIAVFKFFRK